MAGSFTSNTLIGLKKVRSSFFFLFSLLQHLPFLILLLLFVLLDYHTGDEGGADLLPRVLPRVLPQA